MNSLRSNYQKTNYCNLINFHIQNNQYDHQSTKHNIDFPQNDSYQCVLTLVIVLAWLEYQLSITKKTQGLTGLKDITNKLLHITKNTIHVLTIKLSVITFPRKEENLSPKGLLISYQTAIKLFQIKISHILVCSKTNATNTIL